jgi:hypothetical protein
LGKLVPIVGWATVPVLAAKFACGLDNDYYVKGAYTVLTPFWT